MTESHVRHRKRTIRGEETPNRNTNNDSFSLVENNLRQQRPEIDQRSTSARKKIDGLICSICQGLAHGYNFDAITCESCKAFFRRNALKTDDVSKCRVNNGRCVITVATRKRCKACRLAKCFEKGMRADWILTDEERVNKRQKIEENRRLRQTLYPDSPDTDEMQNRGIKTETYDDDDNTMTSSSLTTPSTSSSLSLLSSNNLIKIQQIKQAYADSVRLTSLSSAFPSYPQTIRITQASDLLNFLTNILATRLITYVKLVPEFSSLNAHDKLVLIKYNTLSLSFIRAALNYSPLSDTYHEPNTDECVFTGRDIIQCFGSRQYSLSRNCIQNLLRTSLNDPFILQILLIIMLFSKGSSICTDVDEMEPIAEEIRSIYQAQNVFIELLWKYCENKFGLVTTIKTWLKLTMYSMDAHLQAYNSRHGEIQINSIADQLLPLMKSVLLIVEK